MYHFSKRVNASRVLTRDKRHIRKSEIVKENKNNAGAHDITISTVYIKFNYILVFFSYKDAISIIYLRIRIHRT